MSKTQLKKYIAGLPAEQVGEILQDPTPVGELMLYFMEEVTRVASEKGRYSESYFRTLTGQFRKTVEYLSAYGLLEYNMARIRKIVGMAEGIRRCWGKNGERRPHD